MAISTLTIEGSQLTDEHGEYVSASASIVISVSATALGGYFTTALANPLVPQIGDALDATTPDLLCVRRTPTIIGDAGGTFRTVRIVCEYQLQRQQSGVEALPIRGGASLTQVTTQKDRAGETLKLQYKDDEIVAEATVPVIRGHFAVELVESTNDPYDIANDWVNHINSDGWKGGAPGEWLCTNVEFQQLNINADPKVWTFQYEFERNWGSYN